jgi:hypothetical protein
MQYQAECVEVSGTAAIARTRRMQYQAAARTTAAACPERDSNPHAVLDGQRV